MNIIRHLLSYNKQYTTYAIGLLQAKSYRTLKKNTTAFLASYDLTTVDWALLGILYETQNEVMLSEVADVLGVKAPFVTRVIKKLQQKALVLVQPNASDTRAKDITLTQNGKDLVILVEARLRVASKTWIKGVTALDMLAYVRVLKAISRMDEMN